MPALDENTHESVFWGGAGVVVVAGLDHGQRGVKVLPVPVQDEMLSHEDQVERNAQEAQAKLDWIARDARPVARQRAIEHQLSDAQCSTRKVQQDVMNRPAHSRLCGEVEIELRAVFQERDAQFDVAEVVEEVDPLGGPGDDNGGRDESCTDERDQDEDLCWVGYLLILVTLLLKKFC